MTSEKYVRAKMQTSFDSAASMTGAAGISVTNFSDNIDRSVEYVYEIGNRMPASYHAGANKISGKMRGVLRPVQLHPILASVFGYPSSMGTVSAPYAINTPQPITIDYGVDTASANEQRRFIGCGVTKFTLTCETGQFVRWDADWIGRNVVTSSAFDTGDFTYNAEDPLTFQKATVSVDGALSKVSGLTLTIDRKLSTDSFEIGSNYLKGLSENVGVTISGTLTFTEDEYLEFIRMMFGDDSRTSLTTNEVYGDNSGDGDLVITMKDTADVTKSTITLGIIYTGGTQTIEKRNSVKKTVNFTAVSTSSNTTWALS